MAMSSKRGTKVSADEAGSSGDEDIHLLGFH
jgi:hypothetical protein